MTEYQTHEAVTRQLYEEVSRLKAINAELVASIQKPVQADTSQIMSNGIKPNNSLVQAARQALEVLEFLRDGLCGPKHVPNAITALREALDHPKQDLDPAARNGWVLREVLFDGGEAVDHREPQVAAVEQEPVAWTANGWSVFNIGVEVASGLSLDEAMDYLTDERAARGWSVVCVINKDNMPTPATPQPSCQPLTDKQIQDVWCSAKSEGNQHGPFWFARAIERAHGIGGEA